MEQVKPPEPIPDIICSLRAQGYDRVPGTVVWRKAYGAYIVEFVLNRTHKLHLNAEDYCAIRFPFWAETLTLQHTLNYIYGPDPDRCARILVDWFNVLKAASEKEHI